MINIRRYMQYQMGGLVLLIGLTFSFGGYVLLSKMAEDDAERVFNLITQESGYAVDHLLQPATTLLKLLANVPDLKTGKEDDWMFRVPAQASILLDNKMLSSVYVGGPQGQLLLLQIIRSDWDRKRFHAPPETRWLVQLQRVNPAEGEDQYWIGLDDNFKVLFRKKAPINRDYDPRARPWYKAGNEQDGLIRTPVYSFYATGKSGITLAKSMGQGWVIAMDIRVETLENELAEMSRDYAARIALLENSGVIISADRNEKETSTFFKTLVEKSRSNSDKSFKWMVDPQGKYWWVGSAKAQIEQFDEIQIHVAVPQNLLLAKAQQLRNILLIATLLFTTIILFFSRRSATKVSVIFQNLANRANALANFDFEPFDNAKTRIREIIQLENDLDRARTTLSNFLLLLEKVSREEDLEKLLPLVLKETSNIVQGENSSIYILDGSTWNLRAELGESEDKDWLSEWLSLSNEERNSQQTIERTLDNHHALMVPLFGRRGHSLGLLIIARSTKFSERHRNFIKTLSGFAALTLESRELIMQQKQLFESFIKLLAEAVDAKSPHTGGHCYRVPILTEWLVELADNSNKPCVADFSLDEDMREAVHIAAWLHDCGKVVTPEYVVDKATKLETIYDRIHEVRMRFEVCKLETELAYWKTAFPQGLSALATKQLSLQLKALDDDFAFVAECNLGSEKMSDKAIDRIKQIATRTWTRTIDDQLGLSHDEMDRRAGRSAASLPVQEYLLRDQPEHQITRPVGQSFTSDNPWGFKMQLPELLYDRGEIKNLSIQRGTLTDEERYKINEHIVLTIKMLEAMPFPRHLMNVPEIAGGHHERMDSRGYPRAIPASSMSIPARLMAIADVFEALTATDRPYKSGKSPEESLNIMRQMAQGGHLDTELFELFAQSDLPARYAEKFLH